MIAVDWQMVFESLPAAVSIVDVFGRYVTGTREFSDLLGYQRDELASLDIGRITRAEDRDWTLGYLRSLIAGERDCFETDKQFVRKDGSVLHSHVRITAMRDREGVCCALVAVLTPRAERPLVSDARLRAVLEIARATYLVTDGEGNVIEGSGRYRPIAGYPEGFWEGRNVRDVLVDGQDEAADAFLTALISEPDVAHSAEFELRSAKGGRLLVVLNASNRLADPDVNGIVLSVHDITHDREAVEGLRARKAEAESVAEAQTLLLATVSHELRNPLHAIQGVAELLAAESLPPAAADLARHLAQQVSGLANVTDDLLHAARLDAGAVTLESAPTELRPLIREIAEYGSVAAAGRTSLTVSADVETTVPDWVVADSTRLRQILRNLVGNAVKFTASGSVRLDVRVGTGDQVRFDVTDTGVGIPDAELSRVMEPFQSATTAGSGRGAGLGLAIVSRLVAAMQGRVTVRSTLGTGTCFTVELPLPRTVEPKVLPSVPCRGARILVVEDNAVNQALARSQLERLGMECVIAGSGEEALDLLAREGFDVDAILMDNHLPGLSGIETTVRIRADEHTRHLPIVAVTASALSTDRAAFEAVGIDAFVTKPASLATIREAIELVVSGPGDAAEQNADAFSPEPGTAVRSRRPDAVAVDVDVLRSLVEEFDDLGIVVSLVETFVADAPQRCASLVDALRTGNTEVTRRAAHTLKSSSALLGASELAKACGEIESTGSGDPDAVQREVEAVLNEFRRWNSEKGEMT